MVLTDVKKTCMVAFMRQSDTPKVTAGKETGRYSHQDLQREMTPVINAVLLVYALLALVVSVIQYLGEPQNLPFTAINLATGSLFLILFFLRKRTRLTVKLTLITAMTLAGTFASFYLSGLTGTGVITLMGLQILFLVICRTRPALIASFTAVAIAATVALLVHFKLIQYDASLVDRMNSLAHWIPPLMGLIVTSLLFGASLLTLKKKLMTNIARAEEANDLLLAREEELEKLAFIDPLTGLPNKASFYKHVKEKMNSGTVSRGHIILADIPNFRIVNSLVGPADGDRIIAAIGGLLDSYRSETNTIARLNGVEFIGWAEGWEEETFHRNINKFKDQVKTKVEQLFPEITLDFNFATASFPRDGQTLEECYKYASLALQMAKQERRDGPVHFSPEMLSQLSEEMQMRSALEAALVKKEFVIHYQKKVETATGKLCGLEALARWQTAEGKLVPPDTFIPVLTKFNLMVRFGELIYKTVLSDLPRIDSLFGEETPVSINISPLHFLTPGFCQHILQGLSENKVDPRRIILEITEDVFIQDLSTIKLIIQDLRLAGLGISLDDFGKGFSSLSSIRELELSELKIDKSFVYEVESDPRQFGLVSSICALGHTLGFKVVAEGVETVRQVERLKATGCDALQGYYFSRPEPLTASPA